MGAKVLVIGSGGREHALANGLAESDKVESVYVSPGNAGTARLPKTQNVTLADESATIQFCADSSIDLIVIGPEAPLVAGLSDALRQSGFDVFGASKSAAQLEGSKSFATEFMQRHHIAIPESRIVTSTDEALTVIRSFGGATKSVIKADGLAGGKGVFLPDNDTEAAAAVQKITSGVVDGDGSRFVVQRRNHGPEVSVFVLSDGTSYSIIPLASQDHKRLGTGDTGPNTGGMGVYAPLPSWMLSSTQWQKIEQIAKATIEGMRAEETPYQGVLYIGIMLAEELNGDPIVIEYNARFGDPETEVILLLLQGNGVDVYDMLQATASGNVDDVSIPETLNGAALTICLAAAGYPDTPSTGEIIHGLEDEYRDVVAFHGGTKTSDGTTLSSGGRVLFVTGIGATLQAASDAANAAIGKDAIHFNGMQYRSDIGYRAFAPQTDTNVNEVNNKD